MNELTLLPCPFCGSTKVRSNDFIRDGRQVTCTSCGADVHAFEPKANSKSIEKWNTRASLPLASLPATEPLYHEECRYPDCQCERISDPSYDYGFRLACKAPTLPPAASPAQPKGGHWANACGYCGAPSGTPCMNHAGTKPLKHVHLKRLAALPLPAPAPLFSDSAHMIGAILDRIDMAPNDDPLPYVREYVDGLRDRIPAANEPDGVGWCSSCDRIHEVQRPKCPLCGDWLVFAADDKPKLSAPAPIEEIYMDTKNDPESDSPPVRKSRFNEMCTCGHGASGHEWEDESSSCCMAHIYGAFKVGEGIPCMCAGFRPMPASLAAPTISDHLENQLAARLEHMDEKPAPAGQSDQEERSLRSKNLGIIRDNLRWSTKNTASPPPPEGK